MGNSLANAGAYKPRKNGGYGISGNESVCGARARSRVSGRSNLTPSTSPITAAYSRASDLASLTPLPDGISATSTSRKFRNQRNGLPRTLLLKIGATRPSSLKCRPIHRLSHTDQGWRRRFRLDRWVLRCATKLSLGSAIGGQSSVPPGSHPWCRGPGSRSCRCHPSCRRGSSRHTPAD